MNQNIEVQQIELSKIVIFDRIRPVSGATVRALIESIRVSGQLHPIILYPLKGMYAGKYGMAGGGHRYAACQQLGLMSIAARVMNPKAARLAALLENMHRNELNILARSESILEYAECRKISSSAGVGGKQPHNKGYSQLERELPYSRKIIGEAFKHLLISQVIREEIKENDRLCNDRKFLARLSSLESEAEQRQFVSERMGSRGTVKRFSKAESAETDLLDKLVDCWNRSKAKLVYARCNAEQKKRFVDQM